MRGGSRAALRAAVGRSPYEAQKFAEADRHFRKAVALDPGTSGRDTTKALACPLGPVGRMVLGAVSCRSNWASSILLGKNTKQHKPRALRAPPFASFLGRAPMVLHSPSRNRQT